MTDRRVCSPPPPSPEMDSPRRSSHHHLHNHEDGNIVPCLSTRSSYWDVDSNFGCGDTVSVSETLDCINDADVIYPSQTVANIERCMSCFSKLGAPSMSRSSTGIGAQYGYGQQQVWAINSAATTTVAAAASESSTSNNCGQKNNNNQNNAVAVDRMSLCSSQGSSSNNSEYSIAKLSSVGIVDLWKDGIKTCTCSNGGTLTLRKNGLVCTVCDGSAPVKLKAAQKPPMPLPITTQLQPTQNNIGAYENYDFPKVHPKMQCGIGESSSAMENYDTPRKIHEYILAGEQQQHVRQHPPQPVNTADYSNYDMPTAIVGQMCSCLQTTTATPPPAHAHQGKEGEGEAFAGRKDCACNRVMSWADNFMCRRGNGVENTGISVNKLRLTGEGKMPIVQMQNQQHPPPKPDHDAKQSELYATVDVTKKIKSRLVDRSTLKRCECPENNDRPDSQMSNYINIDPSQNLATTEDGDGGGPETSSIPSHCNTRSNYANLTYAHSLDIYENAKDVSRRASQLMSVGGCEGGQQFVNESDLSTCRKCGHTSICDDTEPERKQRTISQNYLVMDPKLGIADVPGYLPMSPANLSEPSTTTSGAAVPRSTSHNSGGGNSDKSASNPSIHVAERLQLTYDSSTLKNTTVKCEQVHLKASSSNFLSIRTRSASADSSRFLEDTEQFDSSETLCKASNNSIHESRRLSSPCLLLLQESEPIGVSLMETEDEVSAISLTQSNPTTNPVNIRRSESVPTGKAQNRDSSSSNDSGVSTGSLKQRAKDFESLELSGGASVGALRKHRHSLPCTHVTLPRRSKSSDPLKELSFRFRKNRIPDKSTSAEAEIPICAPKLNEAYATSADGQSMTSTVPFIDSRSTSSGTSDMSDYIETLSLSSHSSSDVPDAAR